jgi:predicted transcriptional regulator
MDRETKWEDVSFIIASEYRKKVLKNLDKPKTPTSLSRELNINKAHISRALSELEDKKMIKCLTPNSNKGRLYVISDYGKKILSKVSEIN